MPYRALILCRVVDNYGDAGVCWRFARQLAREHGWSIELLIDQPEVLARLGGSDRKYPKAGSVRVVHWNDRRENGKTSDATDIDILVSAFGVDPPETLRLALAGHPARPLWVQLEYLTAEDWIAGHHGARSPKPADGAVEHFFYPGFDAGSGGLLREADLLAQRDLFVGSPEQKEWLRALDIVPAPDERLATLFCYPQVPLPAWFDLLAAGARRWRVIVPEGVAEEPIRQWIGQQRTAVPRFVDADPHTLRCGSLTMQTIPFLHQDDYDRLLWSADLNLVRGEDSWVRALWAARPFLWQPYRQTDDRHLVKLDAFLRKMGAGDEISRAMRAWSGRGDWARAWRAFDDGFDRWAPAFAGWSAALGAQSGLCARFAEFCRQRL